jgi:serine/threonine protein kinase
MYLRYGMVSGHRMKSKNMKLDFEISRSLFLQVRNKLDGRIYALKRIRLNPRNKQLNKKITREVKLLSQLNHENVVRYFNSWIETVIESDDEASSTDFTPSADVTSPDTNPSPLKKLPLPIVRFQQKNPLKQNSVCCKPFSLSFLQLLQNE